MNTTFRLTLGLLAIALLAESAGAACCSKKGDELARLEAEIIAARARIDPLAAPWIRNHDLTVEVAGSLLTKAIAELDALSVTRAELSAIGHSGQLWGWEADCRIWDPTCNFFQGCWRTYGKEGAYIEFDDPNYRFLAKAELSNLRGTWIANQGLRLDLHADLHTEVGMLKGNRYPCIGGGVGARGGPASGDASADLGAVASLGGLEPRGVRYSFNLGVENIRYGVRVNMGSLPDLVVDGTFPGVQERLDGLFGVPMMLDGVLELPTDTGLQPLPYRLELEQPAVFATQRAIRAQTNVMLRWK